MELEEILKRQDVQALKEAINSGVDISKVKSIDFLFEVEELEIDFIFLKILIDNGININEKDEAGYLFLDCIFAESEEGKTIIRDEAFLKYFIEFIMKNNNLEKDFFEEILATVLLLGKIEIIVDSGVDINNLDDNIIGMIYLMGSIQSIEFLLKKGLNPNIYINNQPIIYLLLIMSENIFEEANPENKDISTLYKDFDKRRYEVIELLLKYGAGINNLDDNIIGTIYLMGSIQSIEFLLNKGLNPNLYIDKQPIIYLLLMMSENLFEELNPGNKDISIIYKGFNERRYEIIELLLKYGADIDLKIHNLPFLYYSLIDITEDEFENILDEEQFKIEKKTLKINLKSLEFLLKKGLDIHEEFNGLNPLIIAVMNNKIEIVKLLLSYGADVNKKDYEGNTSLSIASKKRDIEMMKLLIEHGANIHETIFKNPLKKSPEGLDASSFLNSSLEKIANEKNLNKENFLLNETEKINYNYLSSKSILEITYKDNILTISNLIKEVLSAEDIEDILNVENYPKDNLDKKLYLMEYFNNKIKNQEPIFTEFENISLVKEYLNKKEKALQLLIDSGFNIDFILNVQGNTLFLKACQENDIKTVQFCIRNGADIHIRNRLGKNGFNLTSSTKIKKILNEQRIDRESIVNVNEALRASNEALRTSLILEVRRKNSPVDKKEVEDKEIEKKLKENITLMPFIKILKEKDTEALLKYMKRIKKPRNINIYLLIKDNYPIEFIEAFLRHNKSLVNNIDAYSQYIPLMLAVENDDFDMVKLLLKYGAKVNLSTKKGEAFDLTKSNKIEDLLWDYWKPMETHEPKQLVKLLTNFTIDTPIKYTTHLWDFGDIKKEYGSFKGFIDAISKQWKEIEVELKELSPNLHSKIYNFLLNPHTANWCSRTNISIGWSSLEGLELWCDEGNNPFEFKLKEHYEVENRTITTFGEVINLFKREIEMRNENNMLEHIFLEHQKKLGRKFSVKLIKLKGRTFYTDVEKFQESVSRIFEEIKKRDNEEIHIEVIEPNAEFIELKITQLNSSANRSAKEMLEEVENGDFKVLKENLINLCDWSIESNDESESYRVNYLRMSQTQEIEKLTDSVDGFSHILRFYKK